MLAEHLPPGSHALRGGGWGGQELQAPAQLKPPRAKASRAARAPGGSTARCIQPGQQWPQEPWRSGTAPCPSSLGRRSRSSRSDRSAHCPQTATQSPSQPIPASVGASSPGVGELPRSGQSQDFLSPQRANHHPCLRLSNSQMESDVSCLIGTSAPAVGCSRPLWVGWVVLPGWHGAWGNLKEKKKSQLEVGSPRPEYLPVLPVFLRSNQPLVVRWDGRTCFCGNQKKPSPKWSSSLLPL